MKNKTLVEPSNGLAVREAVRETVVVLLPTQKISKRRASADFEENAGSRAVRRLGHGTAW